MNNNHPGSRLGSVRKLEDGRIELLFERRLKHSVETVWQAITDPEHRAQWAPGMHLELFAGGALNIWFNGGNCEGPAHVTGVVTVYHPPHVLECGTMRFELEPCEEGCLLRFSDILDFSGTRTITEFTNSVLGGWHAYLDRLESSLLGEAIDFDAPEFDYASVEIPGRE